MTCQIKGDYSVMHYSAMSI